MKKISRMWQGIIAIALMCACALFALVACNPSGQTSTPNKPNNGNNDTSQTQQPSDKDDNNTTQTPSSGSEDNDDNNNSSQTPSDDDKQEDPETPPVQEISEFEYKAMFEKALAKSILNDYNNKAPIDDAKINSVDVKLINYKTGDIYFTYAWKNNTYFRIASSSQIPSYDSYKSLNENVPATFDISNSQTVQKQNLAQEILDYALEQQEVIDYLAENGIDKNELKVLNATLFEGVSGGYDKTTLTICSENNIFTISLIGVTGICSTQKDYLAKLQNGRLERVEIGEAVPFEELKVAEDEA